MPPAEITSPGNPRVKWLVGLRKRRTRDREGITLVDGFDELVLALDCGVTPQTLFYSPSLIHDPQRLQILERVEALGTEIVALARDPFEKAAYRENPDGWLAVVQDPSRPLDDLELGPDPLVLVCEAIEKPGNLGAMLRTAEATGVDAVIAASSTTDLTNPNVVRASKGTLFAVPTAAAPSPVVLAWLHECGFRVVVATPEASREVYDVDMTGPTAIVVGAEHDGVSDDWRTIATVAAKLPMRGSVNSLNVATSAAVVLYEALRQRGT